ncbi:MAG: GNAT family N-acetyltransferase [Pikeienuella sp.]
MRFVQGHEGRKAAIADLFSAVFTASEGNEAGLQIGDLVRELLSCDGDDDVITWSAVDGGDLLACIMLSRLTYPEDGRTVFMLSPVAVKTNRQRAGIGQKLIIRGIDDLRAKNVDFVVTYGDPAYYCKTGFLPISEDFAKAPHRLNQPEGWLGQALTAVKASPIKGPSLCVSPFNRPELW